MTTKLPDWLGDGSIDELIDRFYHHDHSESIKNAGIRKRLKSRADRLLSLEMATAWKSLEEAVTRGVGQPNLAMFFWAAMNVELLIELTPEPSNPKIKKRYNRIAVLADQLVVELHTFSNTIGVNHYSDLAKILTSIARANSDKEPNEFDLACSHIAQEIQNPHNGFDNGRFEKALDILAQASRIASSGRQSRNRIAKTNSPNRLRNEMALALSGAAIDHLGGCFDEIVATTVNAILNLVEDGEAITGDSVKKLRTAFEKKKTGKKTKPP